MVQNHSIGELDPLLPKIDQKTNEYDVLCEKLYSTFRSAGSNVLAFLITVDILNEIWKKTKKKFRGDMGVISDFELLKKISSNEIFQKIQKFVGKYESLFLAHDRNETSVIKEEEKISRSKRSFISNSKFSFATVNLLEIGEKILLFLLEILVSSDLFSMKKLDFLLRLVVFPPQKRIPIELIRIAWKCDSFDETIHFLKCFERFHLITFINSKEYSKDKGSTNFNAVSFDGPSILIHSKIYSFINKKVSKKAMERMIIEFLKKMAFQANSNEYSRSSTIDEEGDILEKVNWESIFDGKKGFSSYAKTYFFNTLFYFLEKIDKNKLIFSLILNFSFVQKKLEITRDIFSLIRDFKRLSKNIKSMQKISSLLKWIKFDDYYAFKRLPIDLFTSLLPFVSISTFQLDKNSNNLTIFSCCKSGSPPVITILFWLSGVLCPNSFDQRSLTLFAVSRYVQSSASCQNSLLSLSQVYPVSHCHPSFFSIIRFHLFPAADSRRVVLPITCDTARFS